MKKRKRIDIGTTYMGRTEMSQEGKEKNRRNTGRS